MRIVTEYDSTVHGWGEPEKRIETLLEEAGLEIATYDAGTDLASGERDVQIGLDEDTDLTTVAVVLDRANVEGIVWMLEVEED